MQVSVTTKITLRDILDDAMVSTIKVVTYYSPNVPMTSTAVKKPSAGKSLCLFTNILDVKKKTEKYCIGAAKSKRRAMKASNSLRNKKTKVKGNSKINDKIKRNIYMHG